MQQKSVVSRPTEQYSFRLLVDPKKEDYVSGSMFHEEHDQHVQMKIIEERLMEEPNDPVLFRKLARCRYRLWHLNLDQGGVKKACEAYEKALSFEENQGIGALWHEAALVRRPLFPM